MANFLESNFRIRNVAEVNGKLTRFNGDVLSRLRQKARDRANQSAGELRYQMRLEYRKGTGALAESVTYRTFQRDDGIEVRFYIAERRELSYVTAALGGHFQHFPVRPFIIRPRNGRRLVIHAEGFSDVARGGRFQSLGRVPVKVVQYVRWGSQTGGFHRDVITEVGEQEGAAFVEDMNQAVSQAIVEMTSGG
jgi:hypothetical protein